jgi:hypothetical protein
LEMAKVLTFYGDKDRVTAELVKGTPIGLFVVEYEGQRLVRHRDRLVPMDDEARKIMAESK